MSGEGVVGMGWRRGPLVGVWMVPVEGAPGEVTREMDESHIRREPPSRLGVHLGPRSLSRGLQGLLLSPFLLTGSR